jgi:GDP-4-dehydro-6-deoxy-D-mannose reductase
MRALVTGAGGFLGQHLLHYLAQDGWDVTALWGKNSRHGQDSASSQVCTVVHGDILDAAFVYSLISKTGFDALFHLAGLSGFSEAVELYRTNVLGTAHILEAVRALGCPHLKIVILGSSAEYGACVDDPIHETSALSPLTNYGVSKVCTDTMGHVLFKESGQRVVCARPFNMIGPGQRGPFLQSAVIDQIVSIEQGKKAPVIEVGDLSTFRDFIDVRDVASGIVALAERGAPGEAYNLCSGQPRQTKSIVDLLVGSADISIEVRSAMRKSGSADVRYQRGTFEKLRSASGWAPRYSVEDSLRDALAACRRQSVSDMHVGPALQDLGARRK